MQLTVSKPRTDHGFSVRTVNFEPGVNGQPGMPEFKIDGHGDLHMSHGVGVIAKAPYTVTVAEDGPPKLALSTEKFNELLNGPLNHPMITMRINRLCMALLAVVQATGQAGANALLTYCDLRDARDRYADRPPEEGT